MVKYPTSLKSVMVKFYRVHLSDDDRTRMEQGSFRGKTTAQVIARARILLKAAEDRTDEGAVASVQLFPDR